MASVTSYYGLQKLVGGESLSFNDYAFTNSNMDVIDRVLHKLDAAVFTGVSPIADPNAAPTLTLSTSGGTIPAGQTVRYKFTYVDVTGAETAGSPEATITTPARIASPDAATLSILTTGGTLLAGTYFYILSAYVNVNTNETTGGTNAFVTVPTGSTNRIRLTLPTLPAGADGFNIFRRGPGEPQYYYIDTINMNVATPPTTYIDTGAVAPNCARSPAISNLTFSTNMVTITLPGATPTVPVGYTWKLYRTFTAANYTSSLLRWVITETSQGSGVITPATDDTGGTTSIGSPPTTSSITGDTNRISLLETAVTAVELELGVNPQGGYSNVAARLAAMAATPTDLDSLTDVYLPSPHDGDVLTYENSTGLWLAATPGGGGITWGTVVEEVLPYGPGGLDYQENRPGWYWSHAATPMSGPWVAYVVDNETILERMSAGPPDPTATVGTVRLDTIVGESGQTPDDYHEVSIGGNAAKDPNSNVGRTSFSLDSYVDSFDVYSSLFMQTLEDNTNYNQVDLEATLDAAYLKLRTKLGQVAAPLEVYNSATPAFSVYESGRVADITPPSVHALDYTLALTDVGLMVMMNKATAIVLTVPAHATVAFPIGTKIEAMMFGAGTLTVAGAVGVNVVTAGALTFTRYQVKTLYKTSTNAWVLY